MARLINLTKKRFSKLIVIRQIGKDRWGNYKWLCSCDCGRKIIVVSGNLRKGHTQSCGCLQKERASAWASKHQLKHGHTKNCKPSKIYISWRNMIQRCTNPNDKEYKNYGDRGIVVCEHWLKFENFNEDMGKDWKSGLTIERKNNGKGYSPENCYWATRKQQSRNIRNNHLISCFDKSQCFAEWSEETGISWETLYARIYQLGWFPEKALTVPVRKWKRKNG